MKAPLAVFAVLLAVVAFAAPAQAASAAAPVASYTSPDCGNVAAPVWRIGYQLYWRNNAGQTTSRAYTAQTLRAAKVFVEKVAELSRCGVRAKLDVYDAGDDLWQVRDAPPPSHESFVRQGYDSMFYRFPAANSGYSGLSGENERWALFPVDPSMPSSYLERGLPWEMLLMHEWLHQVVAFFREFDTIVFPRDDVHGACLHGYMDNCMVSERYFADLMSGNVSDRGKLTGIKPEQWDDYGKPSAVRNRPTLISLDVNAEDYGIYADVAEGGARTVTLTLADAAGKQIGSRVFRSGGVWRPSQLARGGRFTVCASVGSNGEYGPARTCVTRTLLASTNGLVSVGKPGFRGSRAYVTVRVRGPLVGRRAKIRFFTNFRGGCGVSCGGWKRSRDQHMTRTLRASQTFVLPFQAGGGWESSFDVTVPSFTLGGRRYQATNFAAGVSR